LEQVATTLKLIQDKLSEGVTEFARNTQSVLESIQFFASLFHHETHLELLQFRI